MSLSDNQFMKSSLRIRDSHSIVSVPFAPRSVSGTIYHTLQTTKDDQIFRWIAFIHSFLIRGLLATKYVHTRVSRFEHGAKLSADTLRALRFVSCGDAVSILQQICAQFYLNATCEVEEQLKLRLILNIINNRVCKL